ncbi:hypothetical protein GCM10022236_36680 [Microlunatus ginsengisoli]|uniref:Uncharacterized protein n=1 Tax=Microlunatus ginsengisoli TaxID=363863 RepID=A0ABP7AF98_9ACTN
MWIVLETEPGAYPRRPPFVILGGAELLLSGHGAVPTESGCGDWWARAAAVASRPLPTTGREVAGGMAPSPNTVSPRRIGAPGCASISPRDGPESGNSVLTTPADTSEAR